MVNAQQLIDSANAIAKEAHHLIAGMQFPRSSPARLRAALFLTIVEQFEAALHLESAGAATHSAVHVRSMLEALVAMNLLGQDSDYVHQMRFKQLHGARKIYQGLLDDQDLPIELRQEVQSHLDEQNTQYDALCAQGLSYSHAMISTEIVRAGLSHLAVPYAMLCAFSHNDLAVLAHRHQGDKTMQINAPNDPAVVVSIFSVATQIMMAATEPLTQIAQFPEGYFNQVFKDMNDAWGAALTNS